MSELISDPALMTTQWLTTSLKNCGVLTDEQVTAFDWQIIGTGKMGDNIRLSVTYDRPCLAPKHLVAKLPARDETARTMAAAMGAYHKELMFYQELDQLSNITTPTIYLALIDESGSDFVILMEDLSPCEPGSQLIGETLPRAKRAVAEAAKLHVAFYGQQQYLDKTYITRTDEDAATFGQSLMEEHWPGFVERFGHGLNAECLVFGEQYVANHSQWVTRYQGVKTLIHGDFRTENILFGLTEGACVVDWQTLAESCSMADVAYFLGGSLDVDDRRRWEKELIVHYQHCLAGGGLEITFDECWEQYREFSMHGLMITVLGAMFSEADERSDQMFLVMAQRHLQHCVDMCAQDFLE